MKYLIYKSFAAAAAPVKVCVNENEVGAFIGAEAARLNYGLYRWWSIEDVDYYDVGPIVYAVHLIKEED